MFDQGFVVIKTFFDEKNRTIEKLSSKYDDIPYLTESIKQMTGTYLKASKIENKKILLKPNWVKHNEKPEDELCLTTHKNILIALLHVILECKPQKVTIGDAPIQGCSWNKLIDYSFIQEINVIKDKYNIPVLIKDFRRVKFDPKNNVQETNLSGLENFVIFDLGINSYLEPITEKGKNKFRVTQYDPDRFNESHTPGKHKYCITKEIFDADLIISVPKLKTHQKAGITAALKNIVGINGDKDFLPHHRIGGTEMGGDSYPGKSYLRYFAEKLFDISYKNQGGKMYRFWTRMGSLVWKLSFPGQEHQQGAAWSGNDTVWRMVMDLNKIMIFGQENGVISETPVRELYSLGDGLIGGQGDGPLHPEPLSLGVLTFTNDSSWHDICVAELMRMEVDKISLLRAAKDFRKDRTVQIYLNGENISIKDLKTISIFTLPPPGWVKHLSEQNEKQNRNS